MRKDTKESLSNSILDALGIVIIFTAGYFGSTIPTWYSPLVSVFSMIVGYVLVKAVITFPEETEAE